MTFDIEINTSADFIKSPFIYISYGGSIFAKVYLSTLKEELFSAEIIP
jgi:hypothetical protein